MTRQLKPQIVDEVSSPNGHVKLPVFFDRNEKDFYVEVTGPNDRVRADSVNDVKKLARELLAKVTEYKWEGIIIVEVEQSYDGKYKSPGSFNYRGQKLGARVEFEFDRMERSKHPTRDGHFVYRTHEIDFLAKEPDAFSKKQRAENRDLRQWGTGMNSTILPYDDETWQGLLAMKRAVDAAQAQLEALVERKDLADKLRLVGRQGAPPMLPIAIGSGEISMTTEKQLDLLVRVLREDLSSSDLSASENRIRQNLTEAGFLGWDYESDNRSIALTKSGMALLDDVLVLFAPPFRKVGGAYDVVSSRDLHVCSATQLGTTQEALCGYVPEDERGWDFPTDLEIAKLTTCPDCWNEKGAKKIR